jgi:hypothetical protein
MRKVYMLPTLEQASVADGSNTIHQIVVRLAKYLPEFGYEVTSNRNEADVVAGHAGMTDGSVPVDVAHCHGLYPTAHAREYETAKWHWSANAHVIRNLREAKRITVPSSWVADLLRRDMHIDPDIVGWGIEPDEWSSGTNEGYVLWNKTRTDGVCSPQPLIDLAAKAPQTLFLTTFGAGTPNIRTVGRQYFPVMQGMIRNAGIYLSTTLETFGISTLEAMACGVPVLGFRQGGTADIVDHGVTGFLVEPGDIDGLVAGLDYCQRYRDVLGDNARAVASRYT